MGSWTVAHRLQWFASHVQRHGLGGLRNELVARLSPTQRAIQRRRVTDGMSYDRLSGYRTAGVMAIDDLDLAGDSSECRHYDAVATYEFADVLAAVDIPLADATFIDLGSGMGRALLLAADRPFAGIVGIEFARELHEIAEANFALRAKRQGADPRIRLIHGDAAAIEVPEGPLVLFLFNSFGPRVLRQMLARLRRSWQATPRPIRLIYRNVQHAEEVEAEGFAPLYVAPDYRFTIYEPR